MTAGLCIVSREYPMLFGYLVLALGRQGAQDVDVIMDRRRAGSGEAGSAGADRRARPDIDEALRLRGYAIVDAGQQSRRRPVEIAKSPRVTAPGRRAPSGLAQDDGDRHKRVRRVGIVATAIGVILVGLVIMVASEDVLGGAARAASAVIEWVRGAGSWQLRRAAEAPRPAVSAMTSPAQPASGTDAPPAMATRPSEPTASVPAPTLPTPGASRATAPIHSSSAQATAPVVTASAPAASPASRTTHGTMEEPSGEPDGTPPVSTPAWSGLPRVDLWTQAAGSGAKRTLAYTVKLSDTEGRPLSGADVWLRVVMPDRSERETRLTPTKAHGTYRGRFTVGTRTPAVSRVRIGIGGTRMEVPVGRTRQ